MTSNDDRDPTPLAGLLRRLPTDLAAARELPNPTPEQVTHQVVAHGEYHAAWLVLGNRPTTFTCQHDHKSSDLADRCGTTHLAPHWRTLLAGQHTWSVYLAGPPGPTLYRVTYTTADDHTSWHNLAWLDDPPTQTTPDDNTQKSESVEGD